MKKTILWQPQVHEPPDKEDGDDEPMDYEDRMLGMNSIFPKTITPTPFGPYLIDDRYHPYKEFELWIGHTNFDLTEEIAKQIENCAGVEVLSILSRYRFILGVGRQFTMTTVRQLVEDEVCSSTLEAIDNEYIKQEVEELRDVLSNNHKKWAIYVLPNGNIDFITEEDENFVDMLKQYKTFPGLSSGILLTSG